MYPPSKPPALPPLSRSLPPLPKETGPLIYPPLQPPPTGGLPLPPPHPPPHGRPPGRPVDTTSRPGTHIPLQPPPPSKMPLLVLPHVAQPNIQNQGPTRQMYTQPSHPLPPLPPSSTNRPMSGESRSSRAIKDTTGRGIPPPRPRRPSEQQEQHLRAQRPLTVDTQPRGTEISRMDSTQTADSISMMASISLPPVPTSSPIGSFMDGFSIDGDHTWNSRLSILSAASSSAVPSASRVIGTTRPTSISKNPRVQSIIREKSLGAIETGSGKRARFPAVHSRVDSTSSIGNASVKSGLASGESGSLQQQQLGISNQASQPSNLSRNRNSVLETDSGSWGLRWDAADPSLWTLPTYRPGPIRIQPASGLYAMPEMTVLNVLYDSGSASWSDELVIDEDVRFFESLGLPRKHLVSSLDNFWLKGIPVTTTAYRRPLAKTFAPNPTGPESPSAGSIKSDYSTSNVSLTEIEIPNSPSQRDGMRDAVGYQRNCSTESSRPSKLPPMDSKTSPTQPSPLSPHWQPRHAPARSREMPPGTLHTRARSGDSGAGVRYLGQDVERQGIKEGRPEGSANAGGTSGTSRISFCRFLNFNSGS